MHKCPVCSHNWDGVRQHSRATLISLKIANTQQYQAVCDDCVSFALNWNDFQRVAANQSPVEVKFEPNVTDNSDADSETPSISNGYPICRLCSENFNSVASYMDHIQSENHSLKIKAAKIKRGSVRNKYLCSFCEFSTTRRSEIIYHAKEIHNLEIAIKFIKLIAIPSNENQPRSTEKRIAELPDQRLRLIKKPRNPSKHLCEKCDSTFSDPEEFRSHRKDCFLFKILFDENCNIKRVCDKCHKIFSSLREVSTHASRCQTPPKTNPNKKKTWTETVDEKKCPECDDGFPEVRIRDRHLLVYHGIDINSPKKHNATNNRTHFGKKIQVADDTMRSNDLINWNTVKSNVKNMDSLSSPGNKNVPNGSPTPFIWRTQPASEKCRRGTDDRFSPRNKQDDNSYRPLQFDANHYQNSRNNFGDCDSDRNANPRRNKSKHHHRFSVNRRCRNSNRKGRNKRRKSS